MQCTEMIFDKRSKAERRCTHEIRGFTGLQELQNYQKHLINRHGKYVPLETAAQMRADSGQ